MRRPLLVLLALAAVGPAAARAEVVTRPVEYRHGPTALQGILAYESTATGKRPGVLLAHELGANSAAARGKAAQLARLGYVALAIDRLGQAGWEHYEIANWARAPRFRSRHNQLYWRNAPYYGLGAGAHGFLAGLRTSNVRLPRGYIDAIAAGRRPLWYVRNPVRIAAPAGDRCVHIPPRSQCPMSPWPNRPRA